MRSVVWGTRGLSAAVGLLMVGGLLPVCSCEKAPIAAAPSEAPPVPVVVATAEQSDAPVLIRTIGLSESKASVVMKPQVTGRVGAVLAEEGAEVKAGQVLIKLDEAWFNAAVAQAEGALGQSKALALDAHNLEARNKSVLASAALSQREYEEAQAKVAAADALVAAKQADLDAAKLNLEYCTISAPFDGRLGQFLVRPGAIVKASETEMVEVSQIDPIDVAFNVPEERFPAIREAYVASADIAEKRSLRVEVVPSGDTGTPIVGRASFIDTKVDTETGTIRLKATFENSDRRLWPGRFVNVTLVLGVEAGCVQIPDSAIQATQSGPGVFVVKQDQTVEVRSVGVRRSVDGKSIIEHGVAAGDVVVIDGQLRLGPGARVQVKNSGGEH